jgi:hypothetical protein
MEENKMKIKLLLSLVLVVLLTATMAVATTPTAKKCTVDLPILGVDNHEWIETNYPTTNDEEIAYASCMKAFELSGDQTCLTDSCVKHYTNAIGWSPGTGAYVMYIHASSLGHFYNPRTAGCDGGADYFIFGYNYDAHSRGAHCMNPTEPGRVDIVHDGTYQGCLGTGYGTFSCESGGEGAFQICNGYCIPN